jgi:phosphopantetheinyl transferase
MNTLGVSRIGALLDGAGTEPFAWLGTDERTRLAGMVPAGHPAFVASRALLRRQLEAATGIEAARWEVSAQPGCEPVARLREADDAVRPPTVSLSHRLEWVAAATADPALGAIGVDVECRRPSRSSAEDRAALMLSADELAAWQRLPGDEREPALLRAWVAKEAWYKAMPAGAVPWDFRRVAGAACDAARANVRVWQAGPLFVALCCHDAGALAGARCEGLPDGGVAESSWHIGLAA